MAELQAFTAASLSAILIRFLSKLLQILSGVIPRNFKQNDVSISNRFSEVHNGIRTQRHTDTHSHTHTHTTIAVGEMQCVAFRLKTHILTVEPPLLFCHIDCM